MCCSSLSVCLLNVLVGLIDLCGILVVSGDLLLSLLNSDGLLLFSSELNGFSMF